MARSVGNIEVTVDADTGQLKAQVTQGAREAGQAGAKALSEELGDISTKEALAKIKKFAEQAEEELDNIEAELGVDTSQARAELREFIEQQSAEVLDLRTTIDTTAASEGLRQWRAEQEANRIDVGLGVDFAAVNVDLARWRAEVERNDLDIKMDADTAAIDADLARWRARQEIDAVDIELNPQLAEVNARIDAWREEVEREALDIRLDANLTTINANLRRWRTEAERDAVDISLNPQLTEVNAQLAAWRLEQEQDDIALQVELRTALALAEGEALRAAFEREKVTLDIDPDLDFAEWLIAKELADATLGNVEVEVEPDVQMSAFARAKLLIEQWGERTGSSGGSGFTRGFSSSISDGSQVIITAVAGLGPGIAEGIEGLLGAASAVISSGFYAIAGGALAAAPAVAALGTALGAVLIGSQGVPDALKAINAEIAKADLEGRPPYLFSGAVKEALEKLSPAARDFARAFAEIKPKWDEVKEGIQEELFTGLAGKLRGLADETIPDVGSAFEIAADSVNEFFGGLIDIAEDTDFKGTMEAIDPALDNAFDAAENLVGSLEPFLKAAGPAAEELTGWIEDGAAAMREWLEQNPDKLAKFLDEGVDSLQLWVDMLGTVGDALATFFEAGKGDGDAMVARLDNLVTKWDNWMESVEGQRALKDFFEGGSQAITDMQPVFDGLIEAWNILTEGEGGNFADLMQDIGEVLPNIAEILQGIGQMDLGGAISNTVEVFGTLAEIFQALPDPLKEFAGQVLVITKLMGPLNAALKSVGMSTPWLAALNLAVSAGVFLWGNYVHQTDYAKERTDELTSALGANLDMIVNQGDAQSAAAVGAEAFNEALKETGQASDDLKQDFVTMGTTMDDAREIMMGLDGNMGDVGQAATVMGEDISAAWGLPADAAEGLVLDVVNLKDRFDDFGDTQDMIWEDFQRTAEGAGMNRDEFDLLTNAIRDTANESEAIDWQAMAEEELNAAAATSDTTKALLDQAIANVGLQGSAQHVLDTTADLVPLYDEYARLLYESKNATDETTASTEAGVDSYTLINEQIQEGVELSRQRAEALREERAAAYSAYREGQLAAEELLRTVEELATADVGLPEGAAQGIIDYGAAADDAADAADALGSALDTLFGRFLDSEEALDNARQGLFDLAEQAQGFTVAADGTKEAIDGWSDSLVDSSEGAIANRQAVRDQVAAMLDYATSATNAGKPVEEITTHLGNLRQGLIDSVGAFDTGTMSAEEYVDTLLGTPAVLETLVQQPGMIDALLNADELTVVYDGMGNPVITEFEQLGLDSAIIETEGFQELLDFLGITVVTPEVSSAEITPAAAKAQEVQAQLGETEGVWTPTVETDEITPADEAAAAVKAQLDTVDRTVAEPEVRVPTARRAGDDVGGVQSDVNTLDQAEADPLILATNAPAVKEKIIELQRQMATLQLMTADPTIKLDDYQPAKDKLVDLGRQMATLQLMVANPNVSIDGYDTAKNHLDTLQREVAALDTMRASPSVTLDGFSTVMNQIDQIQLNLSQIRDQTVRVTTVRSTIGAMSGEIITGPTTRNVGEYGYAEAIIPLDLPLNRVDPSVREMASLLRGGGMPSLGPAVAQGRSGPMINQYFTLTSADPAAVATQALNRAASMAS